MKPIFMIFGFLFLGIGAVGTVIPVLPTVPFLLLASACFAKGSDRVNQWFLNTAIYQNHLAEFVQTRSMTQKTKLYILLPVTALLFVAFFSMENIYGRATILILLAVKYYYFIFRIKTINDKKEA
mgnify:CR=1 FL=1